MIGTKGVTIPEFYKGKSVFLTGGTGFVGKLLIEKLLRSCPDIKNIYVLTRKKKSMTIKERIEQWKKEVVFSVLNKINPNALDKIVPIAGDVMEVGLGLNSIDRAELIENVSIVFHLAASVRFDDFLQTAILTNVRSTRDVLELVSQLDTVDVFVYVGTAYSNCDRKIIEEKFYPPKFDWKEAIRVAESPDEQVKEVTDYLTHKIIEPMPNTYVFTKGIAEEVVKELCLNKFPTCVIRPSIVLPTVKEPIEGYVSNLNGPVTLLIAGGAGIAKVIHGSIDTINDNVYADNVVKATIIASWQQGIQKNIDEIKIYNTTSDFQITGLQLDVISKELNEMNPLRYYLGPATAVPMSCDYGYYVYSFLFHFLTALPIDLVLKILGHKLSILTLRRKFVLANQSIRPFLRPDDGKSWYFGKENYLQLENKLLESDKTDFSYLHTRTKGIEDVEGITRYLRMSLSKGRTFVIPNEREQATEAEVLRYKRIALLDKIIKKSFWAFLGYIAIWKYNLLTVLSDRFLNYLRNL